MFQKNERTTILGKVMSQRKVPAEKSATDKPMGSSAEIQTGTMHQGYLCKDETGEKIILVDGIIASLCHAFDRQAEKTTVLATLSRTFGLENLKKSRVLMYQAFSLQDAEGKIQEKRTVDTLLNDLWEKLFKIDREGHGKVVVSMPYNFVLPRFMSDGEILVETTRDTTNTLLMERMENNY